MDRIEQIRAWEDGDLYPEHDTFCFGHGFGSALVEEHDRLVAALREVMKVSATSYGEAAYRVAMKALGGEGSVSKSDG